MVIAAIHSAHREHPTYSYDNLFEAVRLFAPDVVAVEMRQEDMKRDLAYLERNYPFEMLELTRQYGPNIRGVDWLGEELEGRPVPGNWWQAQSWVKRLERELSQDPSVKTPESDALQKKQLEIMNLGTAASLNDGRYDAATRSYYRVLAKELAGTRYAPLVDFYKERDMQIARNIRQVVQDHPGSRIAVVVGADHRAPVIDELESGTLGEFEMVPVP
jgi:hypothetical protein